MRALRQGAARALAATALLGAMAVAAGCGSSAPAEVVPFVGSEATVRAANLAFEPAALTLPSGTPLRIMLDNRDGGIPHNVKVSLGDREVAKSPIVSGPAQTEVRFGPLAAGTYQLICEVHPNMTGTLVVAP